MRPLPPIDTSDYLSDVVWRLDNMVKDWLLLTRADPETHALIHFLGDSGPSCVSTKRVALVPKDEAAEFKSMTWEEAKAKYRTLEAKVEITTGNST